MGAYALSPPDAYLTRFAIVAKSDTFIVVTLDSYRKIVCRGHEMTSRVGEEKKIPILLVVILERNVAEATRNLYKSSVATRWNNTGHSAHMAVKNMSMPRALR